jgi:hypothetical protein
VCQEHACGATAHPLTPWVEKGPVVTLCLWQEYNPSKATFVKVVPTPNNGSTELVALHRDEVGITCRTTQNGTWVGFQGTDAPRFGASAINRPLP